MDTGTVDPSLLAVAGTMPRGLSAGVEKHGGPMGVGAAGAREEAAAVAMEAVVRADLPSAMANSAAQMHPERREATTRQGAAHQQPAEAIWAEAGTEPVAMQERKEERTAVGEQLAGSEELRLGRLR